MILDVTTVRGPHGDEEPCAFLLGGQRLSLTIIDRWLAHDQSYFKVAAEDGHTYILRFDAGSRQWELTLFQRA